MIFLLVLSCYIITSIVLYFVLRSRCRRNAVFRAPKSKTIFYIVSFTWGLPLVASGAIVALILMVFKGHKPKLYGWSWVFEFDDISWGLSMGLFFIAPRNGTKTKAHEHGHGIQNIYLGPFMISVIEIPSFVRFWYRIIKERRGQPCVSHYDDIWFEGSASQSGTLFIEGLQNGEK